MEDTFPPPLRVLVVDDCKDTVSSFTLLLRAWGHEPHAAHDGSTAIHLAQTLLPDVILLDIGLPHLSGWEVARRLRQIPGLGQTLLVALTGHGLEQDKRRSLEAGIDLHLLKPADPTELERVLASCRPLRTPLTA
jgi:two-component system, chemotaxis family, CheB/CheR fusion protein